MVFNPTLETTARFEQPVAQVGPTPAVGGSGIEALGAIVQGLGIGRRREGPSNDDDRFNASWNAYTQEIGQPGLSPTDASPSQLGGYGRFDPARAPRALEINAEFGGEGSTPFLQQQESVSARVEAVASFESSAEGIVAQGVAASLYPDDPLRQEEYVMETYVMQQRTIAQLAELERDSSIRNIESDEVWDIVQPQIFSNATALAVEIRNVASDLLNGNRINIQDLSPELASYLGRNELTLDNLRSTASIIQSRIMNQVQGDIRSAYPDFNVSQPDQAYFDAAFAPLNNVINVLTGENGELDPGARLRRLEDQTYFDFYTSLDGASRTAVTIIDRFPEGRVVEDVFFNTDVGENVTNAIDNILNNRGYITPESANSMSVGEAEQAAEIGIGVLTDFNTIPNPNQAQMDTASGFIASLPALVSRTGGQFDPEDAVAIYQQILHPNMVRALNDGAFGEEARTQTVQLLQYDMEQDFDDLRQFTSRVDGSLRMVDGRIVFTGPPMVGDDGQTIAQAISLPRGGQAALDRLNQKLEVLDSAGAEELFGANVIDIFVENGTLIGPDVTGGSETSQSGTGAGPTGMDNALSRGIQVVGSAVNTPSVAASASTEIQTNSGIISSLAETESSGRFDAFNNVQGSGGAGHFGRLQFSRGRLNDAMRAGVIPQGTTPEEFLANPMLQERVEQWHVNDIRTRIGSEGLSDYVGQAINGVTITEEGLIAVAHLGGFEGMRRFLESGGEYNPGDAYGTTLMSYLARHGSAQSVELSAPRGATALAENAWATPGMTPLVSMEGASRLTQPYAQERMTELLSGPFQQLQQLFGGPITINDAIARDGTTRETETPGSRHFHGDAIDVDISGMSPDEQLRLVRAAQAAGFRGFGFGSGILHIDMGAPRSWAYGNDTFGGRPVAELQEWVSTGEFPSDFGMAGLSAGERDVARRLAATNSAPDVDPGEGAPSNFMQYDTPEAQQAPNAEAPAQVEQAPLQVSAPEQAVPTGQGMMQQAQQAAQVSPEIMSLIENLTGQGEDAVRELEEFLRNRTLESTDARGPR